MNARPVLSFGVLVILPALAPLVRGATPLGPAFTYQGQLKQDGVPANGLFDFRFRLFDSLFDGAPIGNPDENEEERVVNGLFTLTLDFGVDPFGGYARWLEVGVRRSRTGDTFTVLAPRQRLNPTPYALYALSAPVPSGFWAATLDHIHNTNSGNVGIGTAVPGRKLQIGSTAVLNSEGMIRLASRSGTQTSHRAWDLGVPETDADTSGPGYSFVIDDTQLGTDPEFMVKYGSGNVGIGTVTPAAKVHVEGGTDAAPAAGGFLVLGNTGSTNISMDSNEIMARNDGATATLYLNNNGGDVVFGGAVDIGYMIVTGGEDAWCPAGTQVLGGGCRIAGDAEIRVSAPANNGWHCEAGDISGFIGLESYAICANVK